MRLVVLPVMVGFAMLSSIVPAAAQVVVAPAVTTGSYTVGAGSRWVRHVLGRTSSELSRYRTFPHVDFTVVCPTPGTLTRAAA